MTLRENFFNLTTIFDIKSLIIKIKFLNRIHTKFEPTNQNTHIKINFYPYLKI
jgi:hypothetical protein